MAKISRTVMTSGVLALVSHVPVLVDMKSMFRSRAAVEALQFYGDRHIVC